MKEEASGRKRGRPRSGQRRIISFRADSDVAEVLNALRDAGGEMGAFVNRAIRKAAGEKAI